MLIGIPPDGKMLPTSVESRKYLKAFGGEPPRPSQQDIKDALTSAKMLRATLDAFGSGIRASCGYGLPIPEVHRILFPKMNLDR